MHSNMKPTADSDLKPATVGTLPRIDTIIRRRMHTLGSPLEDDQSWLRSFEQFPRFDKCRSAGFEVLLAA
jgi:hypothetical protein